jgi:hypothetical protein
MHFLFLIKNFLFFIMFLIIWQLFCPIKKMLKSENINKTKSKTKLINKPRNIIINIRIS